MSEPRSLAAPRRVLTLVATGTLALSIAAAPASAEEAAGLDAQGAALVEEFLRILTEPDADKQMALTDFLAPEFQIVRANGTSMDQAEYVENPATVFDVEISDVHATKAGGVLVVSYTLSVFEVLEGLEQTTVAPRLSVFHQNDDGQWQLSAHANFGALDPS